MKEVLATTTIALLMTLSPAIAGEDPLMAGEDNLLTNWSTMLADGVDIGWQGVWQLESATMVAPNGTVQFPSAGHRLVVDYHGNYSLDYSSAFFLQSIQVQTGAFSGAVATVPPAGLMPSGIPDNCALTGQFFGVVSGKLFAPFDVDLDRLNPDGSPVFGLPWLEASIHLGASEKPYVKCPGSDVTVKSTGTVLPIGAGRPATTKNGLVVPYDYEMDEDLTTFVIRGRGVPRLIYVFRKSA